MKQKYIYYTDDKINLRVPEGTPCPEGFHRGRITSKLTPEKAKEAVEKRRKTCQEKYGNPTFNNTEKRINTNLEKYGTEFGFQSPEVQERIKQTNLERYGVENQFQRVDMIQQAMQEKYGVDNISQTDECKQKVRETNMKRYNSPSFLSSEAIKQQYLEKYGVDSFSKTGWWVEQTQATNLEKYGDEWFTQTPGYQQKAYETKKSHGSFNSSLPEEAYYLKLVEQYGKDDIIRQYHDPRYPFACDFYIKSTDTFIELNLSWTHGNKPFENSEEDLKKLSVWEEKAKSSEYYKNAINTWTMRDIKKLQTAKENNLNYIVFYNVSELN